MQKWIGIGNLVRDPESRTSNGGTAVTKFTIAIQRRKKDDGADFIQCVTFGKLAENVAKYTAKGRQVAVLGSIQTRTYDTASGEKRYVTEVVADEVQFLGKGSGGGQMGEYGEGGHQPLLGDGETEFEPAGDLDDLPF
jgi:single-strand DNA-binding protein